MFRGSLLDDFFGHNNRMMREMDDMMGGMMMDPFGMLGVGPAGSNRNARQRHQMIQDQDPRLVQQQQQQMARRDPFNDLMMPFGGGLLGGGLFGGIDRMMNQMHEMARSAENNPNSHMISHSQVITFDNTAGTPQYYEASNSVRKAGDIKEVRKTVRDSRKGVEKMQIGHHIGDRGHVIEKVREKGGDIEEKQEFRNIHRDQAHEFDREWGQRTQQVFAGGRQLREGGAQRQQQYAIEEGQEKSGDGEHDREHGSSWFNKFFPFFSGAGGSSSSEQRGGTRGSHRSRPYHSETRESRNARSRGSGPIIEEVE